MPFIVTKRTVVDIDASRIEPDKDRLACTVKTKDGVSETVYVMAHFKEDWHSRTWWYLAEPLPQACTEQEVQAREHGVYALGESIDPQDGVGSRPSEIRALASGKGTLYAYVLKRPQLGNQLLVHVTFIHCDFGRDYSPWCRRGCVSVNLGIITDIAPAQERQTVSRPR